MPRKRSLAGSEGQIPGTGQSQHTKRIQTQQGVYAPSLDTRLAMDPVLFSDNFLLSENTAMPSKIPTEEDLLHESAPFQDNASVPFTNDFSNQLLSMGSMRAVAAGIHDTASPWNPLFMGEKQSSFHPQSRPYDPFSLPQMGQTTLSNRSFSQSYTLPGNLDTAVRARSDSGYETLSKLSPGFTYLDGTSMKMDNMSALYSHSVGHSQPDVDMESEAPPIYENEDAYSEGQRNPPPVHPQKASSPENDTPPFNCEVCDKDPEVKQKPRLKNKSDLKKHQLRHSKPFKCDHVKCQPADKGFSTRNDLERHKKSVHQVLPKSCQTHDRTYICAAEKCARREKVWPRADNFKQHCVRVHEKEGWDVDDLMQKSWVKPGDQRLKAVVELSTSSVLGGLASVCFSPESSSAYNSEFDQSRSVNHLQTTFLQQKNPEDSFVRIGPPVSRSLTAKSDCQDPGVGGRPLSYKDSQQKESPANGNAHNRSNRLDSDRSPPEPVSEDSHGSSSDDCTGTRRSKSSPQKVIIHNAENGTSGLGAFLESFVADQTLSKDSRQSSTSAEELSHTLKALLRKIEGEKLALAGDESVTGVMRQQLLNLAEEQTESPKSHGKKKGASIVADRTIQPGSPSKNGWKCQYCTKVKDTPSKLRKHEKRHTKPYGCTFEECSKKFGSKNDWKRHENMMHFQRECWLCDEPRMTLLPSSDSEHPVTTNNEATQINNTPEEAAATPTASLSQLVVQPASRQRCRIVFYKEHEFRGHLNSEHGIEQGMNMDAKCQAQRLGRFGQRAFWCGFCERIIKVINHGVRGLDERFDHIDNEHFKKGRDMKEWREMRGGLKGGDEVKGGTQTTNVQEERSSSSEVEDKGEEIDDDMMDSGGGNVGIVEEVHNCDPMYEDPRSWHEDTSPHTQGQMMEGPLANPYVDEEVQYWGNEPPNYGEDMPLETLQSTDYLMDMEPAEAQADLVLLDGSIDGLQEFCELPSPMESRNSSSCSSSGSNSPSSSTGLANSQLMSPGDEDAPLGSQETLRSSFHSEGSASQEIILDLAPGAEMNAQHDLYDAHGPAEPDVSMEVARDDVLGAERPLLEQGLSEDNQTLASPESAVLQSENLTSVSRAECARNLQLKREPQRKSDGGQGEGKKRWCCCGCQNVYSTSTTQCVYEFCFHKRCSSHCKKLSTTSWGFAG